MTDVFYSDILLQLHPVKVGVDSIPQRERHVAVLVEQVDMHMT
jgi:hypothetical protein